MVQTHKGITSWCVSTDAYGILTFPETVSTLICGEMQQERAGWPIPDVILIHLSFTAFLEVSTIVCRDQIYTGSLSFCARCPCTTEKQLVTVYIQHSIGTKNKTNASLKQFIHV